MTTAATMHRDQDPEGEDLAGRGLADPVVLLAPEEFVARERDHVGRQERPEAADGLRDGPRPDRDQAEVDQSTTVPGRGGRSSRRYRGPRRRRRSCAAGRNRPRPRPPGAFISQSGWSRPARQPKSGFESSFISSRPSSLRSGPAASIRPRIGSRNGLRSEVDARCQELAELERRARGQPSSTGGEGGASATWRRGHGGAGPRPPNPAPRPGGAAGAGSSRCRRAGRIGGDQGDVEIELVVEVGRRAPDRVEEAELEQDHDDHEGDPRDRGQRAARRHAARSATPAAGSGPGSTASRSMDSWWPRLGIAPTPGPGPCGSRPRPACPPAGRRARRLRAGSVTSTTRRSASAVGSREATLFRPTIAPTRDDLADDRPPQDRDASAGAPTSTSIASDSSTSAFATIVDTSPRRSNGPVLTSPRWASSPRTRPAIGAWTTDCSMSALASSTCRSRTAHSGESSATCLSSIAPSAVEQRQARLELSEVGLRPGELDLELVGENPRATTSEPAEPHPDGGVLGLLELAPAPSP